MKIEEVMPKKLLFVSLLLFSTGVIFFLISFTKKEVCGQSNTESPCCPCLPAANSNTNTVIAFNPNTNRERLLNRQVDNSGNSALVSDTNTKTNSNPDSCCKYQKKTISLPKVNSSVAPLLKIILEQRAEHNTNYMEYAEYFGIRIGSIIYYFREDNESVRNLGTKKDESNEPEICGRYSMVESFPTDNNLQVTANGGINLWRNFGGRWKAVMDVGDWTYPEIYPLIMTKAEMTCLRRITE